jgi:hypothetical protein
LYVLTHRSSHGTLMEAGYALFGPKESVCFFLFDTLAHLALVKASIWPLKSWRFENACRVPM